MKKSTASNVVFRYLKLHLLAKVLFFFLVSVHSIGRSPSKADFSEKLRNVSGAQKIVLLNEISSGLLTTDPELAIYYAKLAIKLENKTGLYKYKPATFNIIGRSFEIQGNNLEALNFYHKALTSAERQGLEAEAGESNNNVGDMQMKFGNYHEALFSFQAALANYKEDRNFTGIVKSQIKCAEAYDKLGKFVDSQNCISEAEQICASENLKDMLPVVFIQKGILSFNSGDFYKASEHFSKALSLLKTDIDSYRVAEVNIYMGLALLQLQKYNSSIIHLKLGVSKSLLSQNPELIAKSFFSMGQFFQAFGSHDSSVYYLNKTLNFALSRNLKAVIIDCYQALSDIYRQKGDVNRSYELLVLMNKYILSKNIEEKSSAVEDLKYHFGVDKNEAEIQKVLLTKNQVILNIVVVFLILSAILLIVLYNLFNSKRRYIKLLEGEMAERSKAELLLKESETRFRNLADLTPEAIYETDENGLITYLNKSGALLLEITDDKFLSGVNIMEHIHEKDKVKALTQRKQIFETKTSIKNEYLVKKVSGDVFPAVIHTGIIFKDDIATGTRGLIIDITDLKNIDKEKNKLIESTQSLNFQLNESKISLEKTLEEIVLLNRKLSASETNLTSFFDSSQQAFALIDNYYKILFFNKSYEALNAAFSDKKVLVGSNVFDSIPEHLVAPLKERIDECLEGKKLKIERKYNSNSGYYWLEIEYNPAYDKMGKQIGVSLILTNITAKKEVEIALKESQRSLATLMKNLPGMAYRCLNNNFWTMEIVSEGCFSVTGYLPEDFINSSKIAYSDIIFPDDRQKVWDDVQLAISKNEYFRLVYRIVTAQNTVKWVWEQGCAVYNAEGQLEALEGFIIDATERTNTEELIKKSEERLNQAFEAANEGLWDYDLKANVMNYVSPRFFTMLGYDVNEFVIDFARMLELIHNDDRLNFKNTLREYIREKSDIFVSEFRMKAKGGNYIWISSRGKITEFDLAGAPLRMVGTHVDISERKTAEEILIESERKFRAAFENVNYGKIIAALNGNIQKVNKAFCEIISVEESQILNSDFASYVVDDSKFKLAKALSDLLEWQSDYQSMECRLVSGNNAIIEARLDISLIRNIENAPVNFIIHIQDITERKLSSEAIRESEEKFRLIAEKTSDIIWSMNMKGKLTYINPAVKKHLGYSVDEYMSLRDELKYTTESYKQVSSIISHELLKIKNGISPGKNYSVAYEAVHLHKNGTSIWGEVHFSFTFNNDGFAEGIQGVTRNITERKRVEEAMRKSEDRLKLALEASTDGLWDLNLTNKRINYFSPRWYTMLEYQPYEFPVDFSRWVQLIIPEDRDKFLSAIENCGNKDVNGINVEFRMITKNKRIKWILTRGKRVESEESETDIRLIGTNVDISERKNAEEEVLKSQQKYMELAEFLPQTIYEANIEGRLIFANRHGLETFGYTQEEINEGLYIKNMLDISEQERAFNNIKVLFVNNVNVVNEYLMRRKDGSKFPAIIYSAPVYSAGRPAGFRGLIVDITDRKSTEELLKNAKEKAEESDRLKSAFLANMSHEIRTPMNAILGFTELLKSTDLTDDKRMNFIEIISKRGKDLLNIINDIIDISKLESKQLKINSVKCYLNNVLTELFVFYENDLLLKHKKKVELKLSMAMADNESLVLIDDLRLKQILTNLLSNAIKFTSSGTIEFGYAISKKQKLDFFVKDTGIGIPLEKLNIIFDRFRQADDSTSRTYGGTGLGLAISRSLAELMEGEIFVSSVYGKGSEFIVSLPYRPVGAMLTVEAEPARDERKLWNDKTILIVEDDKVNFLYLSTLLKKTKAKILHAENGLKAVEMCKKYKEIDVVLMDMQMPVMNGFEATRIVKGMDVELPVIAQTAYALDEDKQKCIEAGCDDFIAKPIKFDQLLRLLDKYI